MTMTRISSLAGFALLGLAVAGCASMPRTGPVDATRYHLGQPVERASFTVQPLSSAADVSPEYQLYADAVGNQMELQGFSPRQGAPDSVYIVAVSFMRMPAGVARAAPPVSVGLGGATGGYSSGVGGGVSVGLGGRDYEMLSTELAVQIRRRSDNSVVWEGKARTTGAAAADDMQPYPTATRLAGAMFKGFPGESGITITVK